jgi:hypothetical protein
MATVPFRAVTAMLPDRWSSFLQRALGNQIKSDPRGLVEAQAIADVLQKATANDPDRRVVERYLAVIKAYDSVAGQARDVGTIAEYSPLESLLIKRRQDPPEEGPPKELEPRVGQMIDLLAGRSKRPEKALLPAEEGVEPEQHPLDAQLEAMVLPSGNLVELLARSADRQQRDGNWISKASTRQTVRAFETAKIPVHTSTFELSKVPGAVVFDRVSGGLIEMIARHSFGGRKKLLLVNAGPALNPEMAERLKLLGATELVTLDKLDPKQIKSVEKTLKTWANEREGEIEAAVEASGYTAASALWSTAMDELAAIAQGGNAALVQGSGGDFAHGFLSALQGDAVTALDAPAAGDLHAYLGSDKESLVLTNVDRLTAANQTALRDYLLSTANVSDAPGALRGQRVLCTTTRDLDLLAELGQFNKDLARILSPGTVQLPTLIERVEDVVPSVQALLQKAYGEAEPSEATKSLAKKDVAAYLTERFDLSFEGLKELAAKLAASITSETPITVELLETYDQPLQARQAALESALGEVDLASAGMPFKAVLCEALEHMEHNTVGTLVVPGPELQLEVEKILESAVVKLAEKLGPIERIDVEQLQGANGEHLAEELSNLLAGGEPRHLMLVSFENQPAQVQAELVETLTELKANGHIKGVLLATSADVRVWAKEDFSHVFRFAADKSDPVLVPSPEEGVGNAKDKKALDQRREDRLKREALAEKEQQASAIREEMERTGDQQVKVQRRAERGQNFDDLTEGLPQTFIDEMTAKMHDVRIAKWPDEIKTRAQKGELFDELSAELVESSKARNKPIDETLVRESRLAVLETRFKDWPEKIKTRVAAGEHFDDLIAEYRDAATKLGRKGNDAVFTPLAEKMRIHMESRASEGESFAAYQGEYERAKKSQGAVVSQVFVVKLKKQMFDVRLEKWADKIQAAADQGHDITRLKSELVEAWNFAKQPVDQDFLDQMTALSAQNRGEA